MITAPLAYPPTTHRVVRRDVLALALILLVAALTRMSDFGRVTEYAYDQATLSTLALDFASGKSVPLVGIPSSAGIPNSPMTVYVLAIPYLFTDDPQVVVMTIAAFNVFGVGLLWFIAHRYFNPTVALVAGLAYALHPHAIHYSRSIWAQDFHTPILLLALLFALLGFVEGRRWAQIAALPVFIVGAQIHYAAWTLLPAFGWIVWRGRHSLNRPALAVGVLLAALTLIPFAIGISRAAAETSATASGVVDQLDSLILRNKAALYAARLATGLGGPWVGMPLIGAYETVLDFPSPVSALWLAVGAAVALGLIVVWSRWGRFWSVLLWLWSVLPFLVFLPNWTGVYPHYFIPSLPALSLLVAIAFEWFLSRLPARAPLQRAVFAAFALILFTQGWVYLTYVRQSNAAATDPGIHLTPVHYLVNVREALAPYRDILIAGGTTGESGQPVWKALLYRRADCVRELVIASGGVAVFPAQPFAVISPPGALAPAASDLYETDSPMVVPLRPGEGGYTIEAFAAAPDWNGPPLADVTPVAFDNGVALTGYLLNGDRVYLRWTLPGAGERGYQYFAHFLDAAGERVGQQDASFYPEHFWCEGDTIITWIDAGIPAETETLRVGMYALEGERFVNSSVLDDAGNAEGLWADIPLDN